MAFNITLDNKPGSFLRRGTQTGRFDRAIVRGLITATAPDTLANVDGLNDAITEAENAAGLFHPSATNLPRQHTTARRFGPNKIWLWMEYFRRLNVIPSGQGSQYASFSSSRRSLEVYRKTFNDLGVLSISTVHGLPTGRMSPFIATSPTFSEAVLETTWRSFSFNQALIRFKVPFSLNFNPLADVAFALDTTNAAAVTFGDYSFPAESLLFTHLDIPQPEEVNGELVYNGAYVFDAVRGKWWLQFPKWAEPNGPWDTIEGPEKRSTNGWGVFVA